MIGKWFNNFKTKPYQALVSVTKKQDYDITSSTKGDATGLPLAPKNPYRKRPVKLTYDKNEFHAFMLPSEKAFLLGGKLSHIITHKLSLRY